MSQLHKSMSQPKDSTTPARTMQLLMLFLFFLGVALSFSADDVEVLAYGRAEIGDRVVCRIDKARHFSVVKGREKECWEAFVQAHNQRMNLTDQHGLLDRYLKAVADNLGISYKPCGNPTSAGRR